MSERIEKIKTAVERGSGCLANHIESVIVRDTFRGEVAWEGVVEVFHLVGHAKAKRCYGWTYHDGKEQQYAVVLEIPPVDSPVTAVRAAVAWDGKKR